jgi:hypothetical protein
MQHPSWVDEEAGLQPFAVDQAIATYEQWEKTMFARSVPEPRNDRNGYQGGSRNRSLNEPGMIFMFLPLVGGGAVGSSSAAAR